MKEQKILLNLTPVRYDIYVVLLTIAAFTSTYTDDEFYILYTLMIIVIVLIGEIFSMILRL